MQKGRITQQLLIWLLLCVTVQDSRLQAKQFLAITQKENHSFSDLEGQMNYSCINHNQFFRMTKGVLSGKTGFTNDAGYCYVCAVKSEGRTFVNRAAWLWMAGKQDMEMEGCTDTFAIWQREL